MKHAVYKYPVMPDHHDRVELDLPAGSRILTVQVQKAQVQAQKTLVFMWALVPLDTDKLERRVFRLAGTGHTIETDPKTESLHYVGTFQLMGGDLVLHLFEIVDTRRRPS